MVLVLLALCAEANAAVVITEIHCNPDDETEQVEFIELHNSGADAIDLYGWHFGSGLTYRFEFGTRLPAGEYLIVAENPEHIHRKWSAGRFSLDRDRVLGPYEGRLDNDGERITLCNAEGDLVDEVDYAIGFPWPIVGSPVPRGTAGTGASLQLVNPEAGNDVASNWRSAAPSPLAPNSEVYRENLPPYVGKVQCDPEQPLSGESVTVTIEATDADGVIGVGLEYQVVLAGQYVPARLPVAPSVLQSDPDTEPLKNPAYYNSTQWTQVFMMDDGTAGDAIPGDNIYTAIIPAQPNRTLVRYRFQAMDVMGAAVRAPYPDDPSLNFAYYVYDGVPDYEGFSAEMLQALPVHHLLTRAEDMQEALGYGGSQIPQFGVGGANPARFVYNWYGTFVYEGVVYDNIRYRLRGANGRYLGGNTKRSMRFRFNRGHYFQARDDQGEPYATKWRTLTTAKGFDNRRTLTYALNEHVNFYLFNKMGVPAPYSYYFHFRVVDGVEEDPDPWHGDFWGLGFAQETYDVRFLEAHGLEKGNLYKLINSTTDAKDQQRYQARDAVIDGSDHDTIEHELTGYSTPDFIRDHVRLDKWYAYHALAQAIRHYDYWPSANKNATWYFEPVYAPENGFLGRMWTLPWDTDASWGPSWNAGYDVVYNSIFLAGGGGSDSGSNPSLQPDYFNAVREVRDLLWQPDQIGPLLDEFAAPIMEFVEADRRRWLNAPSDAGNYNGLSGAGKNGLAALVQDMKNFAFESGSWPGGSVGPGGRAAFLDGLADDSEGRLIPDRPVIAYTGEPNHPANALHFVTSPFRDPQGDQTFGALRWRIAEVAPDAQVTMPDDQERFVLIADGSNWRYSKGSEEPPAAWRDLAFDDSQWLTGRTPLGYGEGFLETTLEDMRGAYTTIYLRRTFDVSDLEAFDTLTLDVMYDDGVNVWINGELVVQDNVSSSGLPHDGTAQSALENIFFVSHTVASPGDYLVEGSNIIAVQVANASLSGSSDCFIDVRLTGRAGSTSGSEPTDPQGPGRGKYEIEPVWDSGELMAFEPTATIPASVVDAGHTYRVRCRMKDNTGRWSHWSAPVQFEASKPLATGIIRDLRITELMYNPAADEGDSAFDNDDFEFIELKNTGDETLDLSHVALVDGVTFEFGNGEILSLAPDEFVLVVRDQEAFAHRYGHELDAMIAGQYTGRLANGGETIKLLDYWSGTIAEFEYGDDGAWPEQADGEGYSLVPLSHSPAGALSDPINWRASIDIGGSPGRDD